MNKFLKILLLIPLFLSIGYSYEINDKVIYQKDFENKTIYLPLNNYRTLIFNERIKNIELTNSENINAEFIDNNKAPLTMLKILGKTIGNESAIVTFESSKSIQVNFSIMQNLDSIISIVKLTYPKLIIEQVNDTFILKGYVKNYKEKDQVIDIFKKAGISTEERLVDLIETSTPSKMIRVKLYAVEIKNDDGLDLKNNWAVSVRNHSAIEEKPDEYVYRNTEWIDNDIAQANVEVTGALDAILKNAVSLTGGLTAAANHMSEFFNTSLILQYLESEGVANILDETTLITLENKEATFHAGGTIRIKAQTTTAEGIPSTKIEKIKYGLQLEIKAKNVLKDNYVDLEITTSNTKIDWANKVDDIPSFLENEVTTNVLAKNQSTIVLGGLINSQNSNDLDKIPALGDIPILGFLFTSKSFKEGRSELVFFITPEVVDPSKNNQNNIFTKTRQKMLDTSKYKNKDNIFEKSYIEKKEQKDNNLSKTILKQKTKKEPKLTQQQKHEKRVNQLLGYE